MNKGEIWIGTFEYWINSGNKRKVSLYKTSIDVSYIIGAEHNSWDRIKSRDKKFHKEIKIIPIKKVGFTNQKI